VAENSEIWTGGDSRQRDVTGGTVGAWRSPERSRREDEVGVHGCAVRCIGIQYNLQSRESNCM